MQQQRKTALGNSITESYFDIFQRLAEFGKNDVEAGNIVLRCLEDASAVQSRVYPVDFCLVNSQAIGAVDVHIVQQKDAVLSAVIDSLDGIQARVAPVDLVLLEIQRNASYEVDGFVDQNPALGTIETSTFNLGRPASVRPE